MMTRGSKRRRKHARSSLSVQCRLCTEIDLLCALSACPHGEMTVDTWGPRAGDPLSVCRPLGVEVYRVAPELLQGWQAPPVSDYRGLHGMRLES